MTEATDFCELWANKAWTPIDIDRALSMPTGRRMRCRECGGGVRAHRAGKDGMRAHFEHLIGHAECSLGHYYAGTRSPHPKALR